MAFGASAAEYSGRKQGLLLCNKRYRDGAAGFGDGCDGACFHALGTLQLQFMRLADSLKAMSPALAVDLSRHPRAQMAGASGRLAAIGWHDA